MSKTFMPELKPEERLRVLKDNHDSAVETYYKQLNQDEIDTRQHELAINSIKKFKLDEELKEIKGDFKAQTEPLAARNNDLMHEIDTGQAEVKGELFFVPDFDDKLMITYDANGEFVSSRRLRPEEQQQRINFLKPAANDQ
jgi:hypothetical protein